MRLVQHSMLSLAAAAVAAPAFAQGDLRAPLVQPLLKLAPGQEARVVYIVAREPDRLVKLSNLGLAPGVRVQLHQASPAAVVRIGETTVALDPAIAAEIYVRKGP